MSEPYSFILRITIDKIKYQEFMEAAPSQPCINDHWLQWWYSREMYGKLNLASEISSWSNLPSNQTVVDEWVKSKETMSFSTYDEATNIWDFGIIMCSESYTEILPLLVFAESVFKYKTYSPLDFAIIYPYFWGGDIVMAYMTFSKNAAILDTAKSEAHIVKEHLNYANHRFDTEWDNILSKIE
ncbi:hypothetical protein [Shewanella cutis]|uniref:Uncharacterized protein n=1 Tax=Shewanella cutis TaxID=2766780 RepID=A0ABS9R0V0_9GAMM|nr:hypothetical protein [Shewanella sp. PS-2]MCG9966236.1 hypothetical protein [Shewanella sp. PS-2]